MNTLSISPDNLKPEIYKSACPYNDINVCTASISSMAINSQKMMDCCGTEDYDDCPIFLAKILRMSSKDSFLMHRNNTDFTFLNPCNKKYDRY
jgi:hypothetical protein